MQAAMVIPKTNDQEISAIQGAMLKLLPTSKTDREQKIKWDEFKRRLRNFKVTFNEYGKDTQKKEEDGGVTEVVW